MMRNVLLSVAQAQLVDSGRPERIVTTFGVDWPHLLAQVASFCIVCFILYRFAYRPVLKMLEVRRQQIALGLANAEQITAELARTEAQRHEVMAQANAEATKFIDEARVAAARVLERETQKAIAAANQITITAREAAVLSHFARLVKLDLAQHTATIESVTLLPRDLRAAIEAGLNRRYGQTLTTTFAYRPALIAGIRIQVGSDVYDGSVRAGLAALERVFEARESWATC